MTFKSRTALWILIAVSILVLTQTNAEARKRIMSGRGDGMATVQVTADDYRDVASAIKSVFGGDGYMLKEEGRGGLRFSRSAGRGKDFSYGGLAGGGHWEQVYITIHDLGGGNYRLECNVYMTAGDNQAQFTDAKVLRFFGREYKRMLRRVKLKLN